MEQSLIEKMRSLEYAIRQSMTVREDQDEPADPAHLDAARAYGIAIVTEASKGDLLSAVQTRIRTGK